MKKYVRIFLLVVLICVFVFTCIILNIEVPEKQYEKITSCREIFEIGHSLPEESDIVNATNKLLRSKLKLTQETENYDFHSKYLPNLVVEENGLLKFQQKTRLEILNGKLPYLGCKIHLYTSNEIQKCLHLRSTAQNRTHIVFYGDSNMRFAAEHFLVATSHFLRWPSNILEFVTSFRNGKGLLQSWEAYAVEGIRIEYVCAIHGTQYMEDLNNFNRLEQWTNGSSTPPTVLVDDYGLWEILEGRELSIVEQIEKIYAAWKINREIFRKLAETTLILVPAQNRGRKTMYKQHIKREKNRKIPSTDTLGRRLWIRIKTISMQSTYNDVMDWIKVDSAARSGLTFWDSTLPFNLLSDYECQKIAIYNDSIVYHEVIQNKGYRRFMCHDDVHKTETTMKDEMTMLWNLLCNSYLPPSPGRCCQ